MWEPRCQIAPGSGDACLCVCVRAARGRASRGAGEGLSHVGSRLLAEHVLTCAGVTRVSSPGAALACCLLLAPVVGRGQCASCGGARSAAPGAPGTSNMHSSTTTFWPVCAKRDRKNGGKTALC